MSQALSQVLSMCSLCLITLSLMWSGCGGGSEHTTRGELQRCDQLKSFPSQRYLTARGRAPTLSEARERAGAKIARRVSAEVRSLIEVRSASQGDTSSERVSEQIEVLTHFKHAELFKPLARCERCEGDSCSSIVALSRDRAAERLIQDMGGDLQLLYEAAQDLTEETPLLRFTQAWRRAQEVRSRLSPLLNQVRALGRDAPALKQAREMMRRAAEVRGRREERLWVRVVPLTLRSTSTDETQVAQLREAIDGRLSGALKTLNLKRWSEPDCPTSQEGETPDVITVKPSGELTCNLGYVGPQCRLKLGVSVTLCPERVLSQDDWSGLKLVGVHPRETRRAVNHLARSVRSADLSQHLSQTLSPFLIL